MSEAAKGIGNGHQMQAKKTVQNNEGALERLKSSVVKAVINHVSSAETLKKVNFTLFGGQ